MKACSDEMMGSSQLRGTITERQIDLAEMAFPGISAFYECCWPRPGTFLELVVRFGAFECEVAAG